MVKKTEEETPQAVWSKHCRDFLGADIYTANFPLLYGTRISISTFPPKKILNVGEALKEEVKNHDLVAFQAYRQRGYVFPNSTTDTKLSLNCCFEGDCVDWDANSAFFRGGTLVAIVSLMDSKQGRASQAILLRNNDLLEIYKAEMRRVAKEIMHYKGREDVFQRFTQVLKADSPKGQGLHNSYREAIMESIL